MFMEYLPLDFVQNQILYFINETQLERLTYTPLISSKLQIRTQIFLHLVICHFLNFSCFGAMQNCKSRVIETSQFAWDFTSFSTKSKSHFPGKPRLLVALRHTLHFFLFLSPSHVYLWLETRDFLKLYCLLTCLLAFIPCSEKY